MKNKHLIVLILFSFALGACSFFSEKENTGYVARVNTHYLTFEELDNNISKNLSQEDSTIAAKSYIQNWATDKLLLDRAKLNLPEEKQIDYRELAKRYEEQLFKKAYKDALIERELKDKIDSSDVNDYYQNNKANFKLNEELVQLRYLQLSKKMKALKDIKNQFLRFNPEDMLSLQEKSLEFKSLSLNDSIWVRVSEAIKEFKESKDLQIDKSEFFKPENFIEIENENDVYYIFIKSTLKRKEEAPISYIRPTIEQILLNRKKINISKKIEKEITKDATKNNEFEVY
ncbi:MAG: hypothetical protein R6V36_11055 [Psychroflexus sp.]